jgi:hypothetical protein
MFKIMERDEFGDTSCTASADTLAGAAELLKQSRMAWKGWPANRRPRYWIMDGNKKVDENTSTFTDLYIAADA